MSDIAVASRYARSGVTTYLPQDARPETSRILRVAAILAVATGIGVTVASGYGSDLAQSFGRSHTMNVQGEQAMDVLRIQAYAAQPAAYSPSFR